MIIFIFTVVLLLGVGSIVFGLREARHRRRVDSLELFESAEISPSSINLEPIEQYGWLVQPEVQHSLAELEGLGFIQEGTFRVVQMSGLHIVGLIQSKQNLIASVYADIRGTTWVDISAVSVDGEVYTTSNSLHEEIIQAQLSGAILVDKSWSVVELFAQQTELCEGKEIAAINGISFATLFERSYVNDMRQHFKHGGVLNEKAFRCQQELSGENLSEEEISELYSAYVYRCGVLHMHSECCKQFLQEKQREAKEGEEESKLVEEKLLAAHEGIPIDLFVPFLTEKLTISKSLSKKIEKEIDSQASICDNFRKINDLLPPTKQARLVGRVEIPTIADIYELP